MLLFFFSVTFLVFCLFSLPLPAEVLAQPEEERDEPLQAWLECELSESDGTVAWRGLRMIPAELLRDEEDELAPTEATP